MPENINRKLAAILFADIVGYTSLMQADEAKANQYLEKFHNTLKEKVFKHQGQIINNYGDGCVCTFKSAVEAMQCAMEVQALFQTEPIIPVRIGLHSGDVFFKDDNVYGDSVNIASRIESIGSAGVVLFSNQIKRHISNQKNFQIQSLGEFDFKNVATKMEVFALANAGFTIPLRKEMQGKTISLVTKKNKWLIFAFAGTFLLLAAFFFSTTFNKKVYVEGEISLAVVPFRNISGDSKNSHYGLGMASEIRTKLSLSKKFVHLSSLQATAAYANTNKTPKEIGQELKVDYLVMGLFQIAGEDIRVNVELLDAKSGKTVEEIPQYQNKFADIFKMQSEIANKVLRQFSFFNQSQEVLAEYIPDVLAYGHYLKGNEFLASGWSPNILENALEQFETASQLDSNYLSPWVGQINAMTQMLWYYLDGDTVLRERVATTMEYVETHFPESWEKNLARGVYEYHGLSNYEKGRQFLQKALDENPENSDANSLLGAIYKRQLKTEKALHHLAKAKNQSPNNATFWRDIRNVSKDQGDYETVVKTCKTLVNLGDERRGKISLFRAAIALGDLSILPEDWESYYGNALTFRENYFNENWTNCLTILDTASTWLFNEKMDMEYLDFRLFKKAEIFFIANKVDSSQYYAGQLLRYYVNHIEKNNRYRKAFALSLLGKPEESINLIQSSVWNNGNWIELDDEELLLTVYRMKIEVRNYIFLGDYKKATETLVTINKKYPAYGDYVEYKTDPFYNRIKKEYPPFAKALNELKLPELVPFDEPMKD